MSLIDQVPQHIRAMAEDLWERHNERLDDILTALRVDLLEPGRSSEDDSLSWLTNKKFMESMITEDFAKDMLLIALYRLARHEGN